MTTCSADRTGWTRLRWLGAGALGGMALAGALAVLLGAAATRPSGERRPINLPGRSGSPPLSDGVLVGDTLYLAGRLGIDPATGKPPEAPQEEARLILEGMKKVLAEAGMTMDDLVSVQVFCSDVGLFASFNEVYRGYFSGAFPARAFLGSGPLLLGARFEVQGIAVRR